MPRWEINNSVKQKNLIRTKTYDSGLRILKLYPDPGKRKAGTDLSSQLLSSGTSVGANAEEAIGGSSGKDFINKLQIAYCEARETRYWLRLLRDSEILDKKPAESFISNCEEIIRIQTVILNSSKRETTQFFNY